MTEAAPADLRVEGRGCSLVCKERQPGCKPGYVGVRVSLTFWGEDLARRSVIYLCRALPRG